MFRWASPQPMTRRLEELLERAGALRTAWSEHRCSDVIIFLAPHLILSTGRLPHASYRMLDRCTDEPVQPEMPLLINGERLLSLSADDLASWKRLEPLPELGPLQPPSLMESALTSALLAADPQLGLTYEHLDAHSERGGDAADCPYSARLACHNPEELVECWNRQLERSQAENDLALLKQQLLELERECERQFLSCREADIKLSLQRRISQQTLAQLHRYGNLLRRLIEIHGRVL